MKQRLEARFVSQRTVALVKSKVGRRRSSGRADRPHPNALNQSSIYDSHVCGDSWQCCKCPRRGALQCSSRGGGHKQSVCTFPSHLSLCSPSLSSSVAHLVVTVHIRLYCHDKVGGEGGRGRGVTALKRREPRNLISHLRSLSLEADEVQMGSDPENGEVLL